MKNYWLWTAFTFVCVCGSPVYAAEQVDTPVATPPAVSSTEEGEHAEQPEQTDIAHMPHDMQDKKDAAKHEAHSDSAHNHEGKHDDKPQRGYTGARNPRHWGHLDDTYHACKEGMQQSPVNIRQYAEMDLPDLETNYSLAPLHVVNNGHTLQVNYTDGNTLRVDGTTFDLHHLHFHSPSEHYLDGAPYPMEVHFVHKAKDGTLGVIGVMMKLGRENPVIEGIWRNASPVKGEKKVDDVAINAATLLPDNLEYYAYEGSLTTPPCSEGVKWHVLKTPIEISEKQLTAFQNLFPVNARPIQPLNGRVVKGD